MFRMRKFTLEITISILSKSYKYISDYALALGDVF